jgi:hypothetical protein
MPAAGFARRGAGAASGKVGRFSRPLLARELPDPELPSIAPAFAMHSPPFYRHESPGRAASTPPPEAAEAGGWLDQHRARPWQPGQSNLM